MIGNWILCFVMLAQPGFGQELGTLDAQQVLSHVKAALKSPKIRLAKARRLSTPTQVPNFATMCDNGCWKSITTGMVTLYKALESNPKCMAMLTEDAECSKSESGGARLLSEGETSSECMFDTCTDPSMTQVCSMSDDQLKSILGSGEGGMDWECIKPSLDFICKGMCSTACTTDNAEEKKMFCGDFMGGPDDDSGDSSEEKCEESTPNAEDMTDMFNFICVKDGEKYCYASAFEWMQKGAFATEPTEEFGDPCKIDCSTPTGQAIKDMGCCIAGMTLGLKGKESKAARSAIYKCGGMDSLKFCGSAESLPIPAVLLTGTKGVETCPTTATESTTVRRALAKELEVKTKAVTLVACVKAGASCAGAGRRLGDAANNLEYTVTVKGTAATINEKKTAMEAKVKNVQTQSGGTSSGTSGNKTGNRTQGASQASNTMQGSLSFLVAAFALLVSAFLQ